MVTIYYPVKSTPLHDSGYSALYHFFSRGQKQFESPTDGRPTIGELVQDFMRFLKVKGINEFDVHYSLPNDFPQLSSNNVGKGYLFRSRVLSASERRKLERELLKALSGQ